ncbi:MAG: hypothetical protein C0467_18695 [Planctomycetaceae bacterium]|nr:hypothetical protein [Planctomycetaceae bacterium]
MVLAAPLLLLSTLTSTDWPDISVIVFRHHPGRFATQQQVAARERDKEAIFAAIKDAGINYSYGGGLGSGYELSLRLVDLVRWQQLVEKFHKHRSLAYYTEWQHDRTGYGLLRLPWVNPK